MNERDFLAWRPKSYQNLRELLSQDGAGSVTNAGLDAGAAPGEYFEYAAPADRVAVISKMRAWYIDSAAAVAGVFGLDIDLSTAGDGIRIDHRNALGGDVVYALTGAEQIKVNEDWSRWGKVSQDAFATGPNPVVVEIDFAENDGQPVVLAPTEALSVNLVGDLSGLVGFYFTIFGYTARP